MITIDFGRAFYGWITLNNMARVGANYAALHRDSWTTPGSPADGTARPPIGTKTISRSNNRPSRRSSKG